MADIDAGKIVYKDPAEDELAKKKARAARFGMPLNLSEDRKATMRAQRYGDVQDACFIQIVEDALHLLTASCAFLKADALPLWCAHTHLVMLDCLMDSAADLGSAWRQKLERRERLRHRSLQRSSPLRYASTSASTLKSCAALKGMWLTINTETTSAFNLAKFRLLQAELEAELQKKKARAARFNVPVKTNADEVRSWSQKSRAATSGVINALRFCETAASAEPASRHRL